MYHFHSSLTLTRKIVQEEEREGGTKIVAIDDVDSYLDDNVHFGSMLGESEAIKVGVRAGAKGGERKRTRVDSRRICTGKELVAPGHCTCQGIAPINHTFRPSIAARFKKSAFKRAVWT